MARNFPWDRDKGLLCDESRKPEIKNFEAMEWAERGIIVLIVVHGLVVMHA
jgi:hypothetical protein